MKYWILKTEPSTYSFSRLAGEQRTTWDGVSNPVAVKHIRSMEPGDEVMIYHTGDEKAIVGYARVVSDPRPDPSNPKLTVVDLEAGKPVRSPVALSTIKADERFRDLALVRQGRLSVVPVPADLWKALRKLADE